MSHVFSSSVLQWLMGQNAKDMVSRYVFRNLFSGKFPFELHKKNRPPSKKENNERMYSNTCIKTCIVVLSANRGRGWNRGTQQATQKTENGADGAHTGEYLYMFLTRRLLLSVNGLQFHKFLFCSRLPSWLFLAIMRQCPQCSGWMQRNCAVHRGITPSVCGMQRLVGRRVR